MLRLLVISSTIRQNFYKRIIQRTGSHIIQRNTLSELLSDMEGLIGPILDIVFDTIYFHPADRWQRTEEAWKMVCRDTRPGNQYTGELIIIRRVLMQYLTNLLMTCVTPPSASSPQKQTGCSMFNVQRRRGRERYARTKWQRSM